MLGTELGFCPGSLGGPGWPCSGQETPGGGGGGARLEAGRGRCAGVPQGDGWAGSRTRAPLCSHIRSHHGPHLHCAIGDPASPLAEIWGRPHAAFTRILAPAPFCPISYKTSGFLSTFPFKAVNSREVVTAATGPTRALALGVCSPIPAPSQEAPRAGTSELPAFPGSPGPSPCSPWTRGRPELRFLPQGFWKCLRRTDERVRRKHRAEAWDTAADLPCCRVMGWPGVARGGQVIHLCLEE